MLVLIGTLRAATTLPGRTDKTTGEVYQPRNVLQIETTDQRGLVQMSTITVPDLATWADKVGKSVQLPVRAWAKSAAVNFLYEPAGGAA